MRFSPIGRPIRPRPINPIFLGPAAGSKRSLLECGGREARRYFPQKEETIVAELGGRSSEGDVRRSWGAEGKGGCLESRRPPQRRSEARCAVRTRRELRVRLREAPEPRPCSRKLLGPAFLRCAPDIDREFPSENACAGRVARSFVQGRWSGRNRRQRCRRRAEEYRQRDIALQPGAPDRLSNGPYCAQCRRPAVTGSIVRKDSLWKSVEKSFANSSKSLTAGEPDGAVAGFFQRVGLEVLFCASVAFQVGVPERERRGIGVTEDSFGLRSTGGQERLRGDEGHVAGAFDEEVVLVTRLAAVKRSFVPGGAGDGTQAVKRTGHSHVRQRDLIEGMIVQAELAGSLRRETENGFHARVGKIRARMTGEIDDCPGDRFGSV